MSYLDKPLTEESFFKHISTKSQAHKVNIKIALEKFEKFCLGKFDGKTLKTILEDSMTQKNTDPQRHSQNLFSLLQEFVNYLGYEGQDPSTIRNNFNLVKNYLNWYGFEIYSEAVKSRLNFPKKIEQEAYPITLEDIKKLLDNSIEKRKILYLFLSSTGMRISESLQLRKRDLDLKKFDRIMVNIAGKYTKTGKPRKTFVSRETEKYLLPKLENLKDDDLIFGIEEKLPKSESTDFNKMKKIAGLKAKHQEEDNFFRMRIKAGFGELRYDNGIHKITLHSFRSWFITKCNRIDSDFGNALGGHQKYMKKYNRFTDQELCDLFKEAENSLSIFEKVDENQENEIKSLRIENLTLKRDISKEKLRNESEMVRLIQKTLDEKMKIIKRKKQK